MRWGCCGVSKGDFKALPLGTCLTRVSRLLTVDALCVSCLLTVDALCVSCLLTDILRGSS